MNQTPYAVTAHRERLQQVAVMLQRIANGRIYQYGDDKVPMEQVQWLIDDSVFIAFENLPLTCLLTREEGMKTEFDIPALDRCFHLSVNVYTLFGQMEPQIAKRVEPKLKKLLPQLLRAVFGENKHFLVGHRKPQDSTTHVRLFVDEGWKGRQLNPAELQVLQLKQWWPVEL